MSAGCVDAVSYLGLGRVFTANMTGNTVLLGIAAGQGEPVRALRSGVAFAGFALGVLAGSGTARGLPAPSSLSSEGAWPRRMTLALGLELLVLLGFLGGWEAAGAHPRGLAEYVLVGVSAIAMGVQSGSVRRLSVAGIATTYVTGTLAGLVELVTLGRRATDWARRVGVLLALFVGAVIGAVLVLRVPWAAPVVPPAVVAGVVGISAATGPASGSGLGP